MTAIKADTFFAAANAIEEFQSNPLVEARRIKAGDSIVVDMGFAIQVAAEEDGWHLTPANSEIGTFVTDAEFAANYSAVTVTGTQELPKGASVTPVSKGEDIVVQPWDDIELGLSTTAPADGYLVALPQNNNKPRFMSQADYCATFNDKAALKSADQGHYRRNQPADATIYRGVTLTETVTFDFKQGLYQAAKGDVLLENAEDEDGYTLITAAQAAASLQAVAKASGAKPATGAKPR